MHWARLGHTLLRMGKRREVNRSAWVLTAFSAVGVFGLTVGFRTVILRSQVEKTVRDVYGTRGWKNCPLPSSWAENAIQADLMFGPVNNLRTMKCLVKLDGLWECHVTVVRSEPRLEIFGGTDQHIKRFSSMSLEEAMYRKLLDVD